AGRDRRRDKAQRSREIGDALLGRAGAGLGGAPIAFLLLKRLLDTFDLCAQEIELARPHRAESLARDAQLLAVLTRLLIHRSRALFGLSAHAIDLAQLCARANELLDRPLELARDRRSPVVGERAEGALTIPHPSAHRHDRSAHLGHREQRADPRRGERTNSDRALETVEDNRAAAEDA